jgi:hypothetical protein
MRKLLAALMLAALAGPAIACINDIELKSHEREFRSQYRASPQPAPKSESADPAHTRILLASGAVLLVGATVFAAKKPRPRV